MDRESKWHYDNREFDLWTHNVEQSLENTSDVDGLDFYGTLRSNSDPILGGNRHNPADALVVITDCVWGTDAPHLFSQI